ncbi:MAG TPA: hypothetical protein VGE90_10665, partial [Chitinophaga sp.]
MIQFYKRMPALTLGIAMACSGAFPSCSKSDDTPPDNNLILQENFDTADNALWKTGNNGTIVTSVKDGWFVLSYTSRDMGTYSLWSAGNVFPADQKTGSVEILFRHTAGHAYDKAGLVFWVTNNQDYVAFTIGEKEYRIFQVVDGQTTNLVNWTTSAAIKGKLNEDNKLKVALTAEKLLFYINDQKVIEIMKGPAATLDKIGFQMSKASTEVENSTFKIDYVKV